MLQLILIFLIHQSAISICDASLSAVQTVGNGLQLTNSHSRNGIVPSNGASSTFHRQQNLAFNQQGIGPKNGHQHSFDGLRVQAHKDIQPIEGNKESEPSYEWMTLEEKADFKLKKFNKGLESKFLDVGDNVKLHYVHGGNSESENVLLFVHGFPENWYAWRHQLKELKKDYKVYAVDLRGFGKSSKPEEATKYSVNVQIEDIAEMVKMLRKTHPHMKVTLIAHDIGAVISSVFNYKYGDLIERFVMINAPNPKSIPFMLTKKTLQFFQFLFQTPYIGKMIKLLHNSDNMEVNDFQFLTELFLTDKTTKLDNISENTFDEADLEIYKWAFFDNGDSPGHDKVNGALGFFHAPGATLKEKLKKMFSVWNWFQILTNNKGHPTEEPKGPKFKKIKAKTMILWGKDDQVFKKDFAEAAQTECEQSILFPLESSHWVQEDVPQIVNEKLKEFIQGRYDKQLKKH